MTRILAFGDSLTWGYKPDRSGRYPPNDRWPEAMEKALDAVSVIPDGLNGRLTAYNDYASPADLNGARLLPTVLTTHKPIDLTIIMLGTNDICAGLSLRHVARGLLRLVEIIRTIPPRTSYISPKVLLVAPPAMRSGLDPDIGPEMAERSTGLSGRIADVAALCDAGFFDAGSVVSASDTDGVHFAPGASRVLGEALAVEVRAQFQLG